MKGLEDLHLSHTGISELPPSLGNLTGLKVLSIVSNLTLPGSIYTLQHLETLSLKGNITFPKDVEIDGQPLFTITLSSVSRNHSGFNIHVDISINGSKRTFTNSAIYSETKYGHLCFYCRPQSSLQEQFQDLNLGDQNHVELFCKTNLFYRAPSIKAIGVHVECNCPQPQNVEPLGLSMDNYEARSCTCLCGAQTCCCCLKEVGSTHSAGRASAHSSNLESQIISSDTDGGGSSLVSVPSNSGLPMDVTNGSEFTFGFDATIGDEFDLGSSSINDDSDFSPYPQSKKMRTT
ncbi:hypothetical protein CMV_023778 [Castanea mollissima]|uniref:Uncharacterized protein n=1 Tax=Castanea mollissima TaxID=60419 RepID=A0A8J4QPH0_9ROSI|nr:hypothetical protein CMV_023778 [Castanea mollissima]